MALNPEMGSRILLVTVAGAAFALDVLISVAVFLWLGSSPGKAIDGFSIGTYEDLVR